MFSTSEFLTPPNFLARIITALVSHLCLAHPTPCVLLDLPSPMVPFRLSKEARLYRKALFDGGRLPTDEEKWRVYDEIVNIFGCSGYTRRQHSNWCTQHERSRRTTPRLLIATKLDANANANANANPTLVDVTRWAYEIGVSERDAFRLIGELLPEKVKF